MEYIVSGFLVCLSIEDTRKKELPVWLLIVGGFGCFIYGVLQAGIGNMLIGMLPGIFMMVVSMVFPQSLGMGDGIVIVLHGMIYGWKKTCVWVANSFLIVACIGVIISCIKKKTRMELPFVPFLTVVYVGMCL